MKLIFCALIISISNVCLAQKLKVYDVVQNGIYELNGGLRSQFGGKSRTLVQIDGIPKNAIALIYTVHAYKIDEHVEKELSIALSLGALLTGNTPLASALEKVQIPPSTQTVDMYLLPSESDAQLFYYKNDGKWRSYGEYNEEGCMKCRVIAKWPLKGNSHAVLGIKNPSELDAIKVVVNVAYVVEEVN